MKLNALVATLFLWSFVLLAEEKKQPVQFDGEQARSALVALIADSEDEVLKVVREKLKTDMIVILDEGKIEINKWKINLRNKTFKLSIDFKNHFVEYSGEFQFTSDNKWIARISKQTRTQSPD